MRHIDEPLLVFVVLAYIITYTHEHTINARICSESENLSRIDVNLHFAFESYRDFSGFLGVHYVK